MSDVSEKQVVLVVDDECLNLEVLKTALVDAGFDVVEADSFRDAIASLEAEPSQSFSGVVTDINLGGDETGWDLARRARELSSGLPVVYITGDAAQDWTAQGVPHSTLVTKPFAAAQVVVALSSLMNKTDPEG